jgi:DNA-binding HxlR family transcriptional regulator
MSQKNPDEFRFTPHCHEQLRAIYDTLDLVSGKWRIAVISSLNFLGESRFGELQRIVDGIGAKMLSQVLKELEDNELVIRTVHDTKPVTVSYKLTDYGRTLEKIIEEMASWGLNHRRRILSDRSLEALAESETLSV